MDQNRCLLDVIDNPQLLQSFLESESSAETNGSTNNNNNNNNLSNNIATNNNIQDIQVSSSSAPATPATSSIDSFPSRFSTQTPPSLPFSDTSVAVESCQKSFSASNSAATTANEENRNNDNIKPDVEDEYSDLRETISLATNELILDVAVKQDAIYNQGGVANSPSQPQAPPSQPPPHESVTATEPEAGPLSTTTTTAHPTTVDHSDSLSMQDQDVTVNQQHHSSISNDIKCNSFSSNHAHPSNPSEGLYSQNDINESVSLATDEIISNVSINLEPTTTTTTSETDARKFSTPSRVSESSNITASFDVTDAAQSVNSQTSVENQSAFIGTELSCLKDGNPSSVVPSGDTNFVVNNACVQPSPQTIKVEKPSGPTLNTTTTTDTTTGTITGTITAPTTGTITTTTAGTITTSTTTTTVTSSISSVPTPSFTTTSSTPAPKPTSTSVVSSPSSTTATTKSTATKRAPRRSTPAKNKKTASSTPATSTTQIQQPTIQPQFSSPQNHQQMIYTTNNSAIRQPSILGTSPMTGIPQQQRVITINTPNGPMIFAIAPGPALNNNPMMNQQNHQQQQQQQPQQQQHQQQQQQPGMQSQQYPSQQVCFQPNSTVMINRPQTGPHPTQQRIVIPSSQAMMMPRMPNQVVINRPMASTGPLLPGQQQFIQIQTPNGPVLLAISPQQAQPAANPTMIDYNNQIQQQQHQQSRLQQQQQQQPAQLSQPQHQIRPQHQNEPPDNSKNAPNSKSGLDLADLLLDCGILPEDRTASTQSPGIIKASPSPSIPQVNSPMPTMSQISSPMTPIDSLSLPTNSPQQPMHSYAGQQIPQQPVRFTLTADGKMIMQPTIQYSTMQPILANTIGQPHLNSVVPNNLVPSNSPMTSSNSNFATSTSETNVSDGKKPPAKGKGPTKRSRSKKSDLDKFPTLKTPKMAQQQQQQQQQQQHIQAVTVPQTVLVVDQNKVLAAGPDVKPNITQLASGQQISLAKIVTPVIQAPFQPIVSSNMIRTSIPSTNMLGPPIGQNQASLSSVQNTQIVVSNSGSSINGQIINTVQNSNAIVGSASQTLSTTSTSQISSSGNVTTNLLQNVNNMGTVESNPHHSSSLMPHTLSLMVDTHKIEQNGLKMADGKSQIIKGVQNNGGLTTTTTLVLHQPQAQPQHPVQHQMSQVQQVARQVDIRAQLILNQLGADQNAALNPQIEQSFKSLEDACKRLLRYHVFDTETVSDAQIKKVDEIFEAAAESLLTRKKAIYDKYRLLILKQSMKTVPSNEEVMLEQIFVNDEQNYLKKERELFREYEAHLENLALKQTRADSRLDLNKDDGASEYFAFGENSPKQNNQDDLENVAHPRDVDEWLLTDKWGKSHYPSVPDSEAATAIESILNEELS